LDNPASLNKKTCFGKAGFFITVEELCYLLSRNEIYGFVAAAV